MRANLNRTAHSHAKRYRALLVILGLTAAIPTVNAQPQDVPAADAGIQQALSDARNHLWDQVDQAALSQHVLEGYITYHRLLQQLPDAPPATINQFIRTHEDSPLSEWMRGQAQDQYGKSGNLSALLAVSDGTPPKGTQRQCYYYSALMTQDMTAAAHGARELWRTGQPMPGPCAALYDQLRVAQQLTPLDDWTRLLAAWQRNDAKTIDTTRALITAPAWQPAVDAFLQLRRNPAAMAQLPAQIGPAQFNVAPGLMASAFYRYTRDDTANAVALWQQIGQRLPLNEAQQRTITSDLVSYALTRRTEGSSAWVDQQLARLNDDALIVLRIRNALSGPAWNDVARWVETLSPEGREDSRWQYWLARAREAQGQTAAANEAYARAARGRDFYAFVSADRLGQPYQLNHDTPRLNEEARQRIRTIPAVQRVDALYRVNEASLAVSEWQWLLKRASAEERGALGAYALEQRWYALTVAASLDKRLWGALGLRFPVAYPELFAQWGRQRGLDTYLLMGIARRESAFNPTIQSSAGARGLMQLMPGTAQLVHKREGVPYDGVTSLDDPNTNIGLGSSYIGTLLQRYNGNRIAAVAAYNAGPNRIDRWLKNSGQPFDLFIEQIPFKETREYVLAVLGYRSLFERMNNPASRTPVLTDAERTRLYDGSILNTL